MGTDDLIQQVDVLFPESHGSSLKNTTRHRYLARYNACERGVSITEQGWESPERNSNDWRLPALESPLGVAIHFSRSSGS